MKRNLLKGSRGTQKGLRHRKKVRYEVEIEEPVIRAHTPALDKLRKTVARMDGEFSHRNIRTCHSCHEPKKDIFRTKRDKDDKVIVRKMRGCGCPARASMSVEMTHDMAMLARQIAYECGRLSETQDAELFAKTQRLVRYLTFTI